MSELLIDQPRQERGAATLEFALVSSILFAMLFGIIEIGRVLFFWNTATEATRWGARMAVVCDLNTAMVKTKMISLFPFLSPTDISITYDPVSCTAATCNSVTVSVAAGKTVNTYIPWIPLTLTMPSFATTLPRESLDSASGTNPICI